MTDYEEIDAMLNESASWAKKKQPYVSAKNIFPAKKQTFTQGTNVSFNRSHPTIKKIINYMREGRKAEAESIEENEFQRAIISHLEKFDVDDDNNAFIRQIHSGRRGENSPVEVILGFDVIGSPVLETITKQEIYAIDGRKYRGRLNNLLPSPSTPMEVVQEQPASQEVVDEEEIADWNLAPEDEENKEVSNPDGPADEMISAGGKNEESEPVEIPADDGEPVGSGQSASSPKSDILRRLLV